MKEYEKVEGERILTEKYDITPNGGGQQARLPKAFLQRHAEAAKKTVVEFSREKSVEFTWVWPPGTSVNDSFCIMRVVDRKNGEN